ncbi:phage tail protein [Solidesulfovibrio sp.]
MGQVGSLGDVAFEVSSQRIMTWNDCVRDTTANFAAHEVIESKARLQFLGLGLEEFSLAVTLDASWCSPEVEMKKFDAMQQTGQAHRLIIGGRIFGRFVLEGKTENRTRTDDRGRTMVAHVQLKLKEYN